MVKKTVLYLGGNYIFPELEWASAGYLQLIRLTNGSCRLSDLYVDSPDSSEYSTGSTLLNHVAGEKIACSEAVHSLVAEPQPTHIGDHKILADVAKEVICVAPSNQSEKILKRKKRTW